MPSIDTRCVFCCSLRYPCTLDWHPSIDLHNTQELTNLKRMNGCICEGCIQSYDVKRMPVYENSKYYVEEDIDNARGGKRTHDEISNDPWTPIDLDDVMALIAPSNRYGMKNGRYLSMERINTHPNGMINSEYFDFEKSHPHLKDLNYTLEEELFLLLSHEFPAVINEKIVDVLEDANEKMYQRNKNGFRFIRLDMDIKETRERIQDLFYVNITKALSSSHFLDIKFCTFR